MATLGITCQRNSYFTSRSAPAAATYMQHEHCRVPVTALAFWNQDVLLAGEGTFLKAYDIEQRCLLTIVDVLPDQAIHGIIAEDGFIFVWGGRIFCQLVAHYDLDGSLVLNAGPIVEAEDWILNAGLSPATREDIRRLALVTAHNSLAVAVLSKPLRPRLRSVVPGSNCILYAAHVTWLSASTCLIASGTAFGDVIVWSCSLEGKECDMLSCHQTHYSFSAHEGSVFGVRISSTSVASALGGRKHVLASCSDDRTIRIWDISKLTTTRPVLEEEQRETGFGSKSGDDTSAPTCLSKTIGHISRIWHTCFLQDSSREDHAATVEPVRLVSFGEDASCISWRLQPQNDDNSTYLMEQLEAQKAHGGKNIWSVATDRWLRVATGGADGSVALRSFDDLKGHGLPREISHDLMSADEQRDSFKTYAFIGPSTVIATMDSGKLMLLSFDADGVSCEEVSSATGDLRGYSTMASVPSLAFSAGTQGSVYGYIHGSGEVVRVVETGTKVAGLFSQAQHFSCGKTCKTLGLVVTNVASHSAVLCYIKTTSSLSENEGTLKVVKSTLILPASFVVTSFAHTTHGGKRFAVLGSRSGSIAVYSASEFSHASSMTHSLLNTSAHGKEAVTSLYFIKSDGTDSNVISLLSTGRDGTYAGHRLELTCDYVKLQTVHQLSPPFGPNVEGLGYSQEGHLWIWGFRSKKFVVWDTDTQSEVMKVECGGANRNWAFHIGVEGGTFVWTKASKVYHETHSRSPFHSINSGGHGREIKSLAISPLESQLIATGAEDTDIKLSSYDNGIFECLHTLQKHNTGIQHLQWSADGQYLFSSGGFEEFYVWKISYDIPGLRVGVLCESAHPNSGKSDLRVMHFGAENFQEEGFSITMLYSDSSVRAWRYVSKSWEILATGNYLTACLTQCLPIAHGETSLITASTDGHLGTWRTFVDQGSIDWLSRHRVHQSAILSLVSHDLVDRSRLIFTGGDDNALGITRIGESSGETRTLLVPRAHAAAVTALLIVGKQANRLHVITASIDQRIKLWQVDVDLSQPGVDGIDIKLLQSRFSPVADVSSIGSIILPGEQSGVLICGVGMDIWKIESA